MTEKKEKSMLALEWNAIGKELGIRVVAPASIVLSADKTITVDVLLPDFGYRKGMMLVADSNVISQHRREIVEAEYGYSVLSKPSAEEIAQPDLEIAKEVLRDWGWGGRPEDEPAWMQESES